MFRWFQLARRLSELEDQMLKLARIVSDKELDWTEMRARCKRLLDRTEQAAKRLDQGVQSEESTAPEGPLTNGDVQGGPLSARQKAIQQHILRRRAGIQ